jgi:tetratricopeptide (TPR) repeat protein
MAPADLAVDPGFSAVDRLVIDAAVAAAQRSEGALLPAALEALVEEVIALNATRSRSCFHRGFVAALMGGAVPAAESDRDRRTWQLCGFLCGADRMARRGAIQDAIAAQQDAVALLLSGTVPGSGLAAPVLFEAALRDAGLAAASFRIAPAAVSAGGTRLFRRVLDEAITHMRTGRIEDAAPALELLDATLRFPGATEIDPDACREHRRRMGQLHRRRGEFERAAKTFDEILGARPPEWMRRKTLCDLGLCRARLRALGEVRLPARRGDFAAFATALGAGEAEFRESAEAAVRTGGHGDFCLGVLLLARGRAKEALPLFDRAIAQMSAEPQVYDTDGVLPRARLYRVLAGGISDAEGDIAAAIASIPGELGPFLGEVLLEVVVSDAARAAEIARAAHARLGDTVVDTAIHVDLLDKLASLRASLLVRAETEGVPAERRFQAARHVLSAARDAGDYEQAREAFDVLQDLAARTEAERRAFLALANDLESWEAVWDPHEVRFSMVPFLIQEGRSEDAAQLLIDGARDLVARGDENSVELARESIEQAHLWGADVPADLKRVVGPPPALAAPSRRPHGRILLIGGNETQQQYASFLQEHVRVAWPGVTLDIEFPGWSSNWGRELPRFETKIQNASAVVLLKFVRTLFGHRMRAYCSKYGRPWVPCTGHGRDSIQRAVDRAILLLA